MAATSITTIAPEAKDPVKCCHTGCEQTTSDPDADPWSYMTSGDDPRIGWLKEGYYCPLHAAEIDARVRPGHD